MRTFHCDHCRNPVYFENTRCNVCGHSLGFLPEFMRLTTLRNIGGGRWVSMMPAAQGRVLRQCENYSLHKVCNWMVPVEADQNFCTACQLNEVIPNLTRPGFVDRWYRLERSKRRLIYSLGKLGLPLHSKEERPDSGLAFRFLSQLDAPPDEPVMTGHASGRITINIDEADASIRERNRLDLNEQYRTLQGHFRHEVGHYYWDTLVRDSDSIDGFRRLFGDERADYGDALNQYYEDGAPSDWNDRFISPYASSHPWEDWAETWAHYLHIVDTLETAENFGLSMEHSTAQGRTWRSEPDFDPYRIGEFEPIIDHWVPMTFALNSLNRSMGLQDLYPFVMPGPAIEKLQFVHDTVRRQRDFLPNYIDMPDRTLQPHVRTWLQRMIEFARDRLLR